MKLLILYYSFTGNNELLAKHLACRFVCRAEAVLEKRKRRPLTILLDMLFKRRPEIHGLRAAPADFDHVLFLAPLWNMGVAHPMASAIRQTRDALPDYSFVSLCGYERAGQREHLIRELRELTGKSPSHVWELPVSGLVPPEDRDDARVVSSRRVAADELSAFGNEIEEIVRALEPARAGSPPPGAHTS